MLRKVLASCVFLGTVASAAILPSAAFADTLGNTVLQYGSTGPEVTVLQQQLKDLGYFPSTEDTTEYFGNITKQAVLAFKKDHDLNEAEKVGKTTEGEILKALKKAGISETRTSDVRTKIIQIAKGLEGTPYAWGGTSPSGFDCSGFTKYVFSQIGIDLPRTSEDQYNNGTSIDKSALKPGDLVFFNTYGSGASHVGIYLGGGNFIHAASEKVQIDSIDNPYYWQSRYVGAKSVINQ
ncbi:NlpC/P60 family protein [Fodinisporobacter ferrooxydans]|uniref:NlpC/P60 family protein n=1 Tax=Fodinisporobacter ferrooxydans TaxID=2901836 RepID=A0ABY4CEF8_9BACL|nr:NlpC/P60 family protein [Alicyclobacillaceae bacterium MYW30-H2]